MDDQKYLLSSVANAFKILDLLGEEERLGLGEISTRLGMNKTSVYRYLYTLEAGGYIRKTSDAKYMLGSKFIYMASIIEERQTEFTDARHVLVKLRDTVGETVHLSILLPDLKLMFVEKVAGTQTLQMRSRVGYQIPAYQSGCGKVLLASLLGTDREKEIYEIELKRSTDRTITDIDTLLQELKLTRERGYGEENGEAEQGLSCLAVPICNYDHETIAAISISGPTDRLREHHDEYLRELRVAKRECEERFSL